jgi:N-carbamoylputrescine amidase
MMATTLHHARRQLPCAVMVAVTFMLCAMPAQAQRRITVAAVQSASTGGPIETNLAHAEMLVRQAAGHGAELVLLPELMPSGYILSPELWDAAEPSDGPTAQWLRQTAWELGIWLGTTFLEADGADFYNTFVLAGPDGGEAGRVRKQRLAGHETLFVRGQDNPHVIQTAIGTIGVGICFESTQCFLMRELHAAAVDLVLLPHADPLTEGEFRRPPDEWTHDLSDTARLYATALGVPAVLANHGGPWNSPLPGCLPAQHSWYRGQSTIVDAGGDIQATLAQDEGCIVAAVTIDPSRKNPLTPPCFGQYCKEMDPGSRLYQITTATIGSLSYLLNPVRRHKALAVSGAADAPD